MTRTRATLRALVVGVLCLAPVPGDIGGCGQPAVELDAPRFFQVKKAIDCLRCEECQLLTVPCVEACDGSVSPETDFAAECLPVVHDDEVCLRRLLDASCSDYAGYVSESDPVVPSECNFCPREAP